MGKDPLRKRFDEVYDHFILNKSFVEDVKYYHRARERYWRTFLEFRRVPLPDAPRTLDIGGGQFGIILRELLGHRPAVGDVVDRAEADVRAAELEFHHIDLMAEPEGVEGGFDCITLLEVIEHIPQPPYLVLRRLMKLLRPGGVVFMTTPNGHSVRNLLYMIAGREILDDYRYPEAGEPLGHQHEYTRRQMERQLRRAGLEVLFCETYDNGRRGHATSARIAHALTRPAYLIPHMRSSLVMAGRLPK